MNIICIADEDTNIMFGLIGIQGFTLPEMDFRKFKIEFEKILSNKSIDMIIMNEKYLLRFKNYFKGIKSQKFPIIVEIPDIKAPFSADYYNHFIKQYLGLSIGDVK
ncbi:V-type ATP synthase subunit F [Candidatus Harpocratesius sp.]